MPYTSNKGLSVPTSGALVGTWGTDGTTPTANTSNALNQGVTQLLDQALGGTATYSLTSTAVAITQLQAQNGLQRFTGTLLANIAVSPDSGVLMVGIYSWENITTGSFSVTLSNSAGSVVLPQGRRGLLWIDTTNGPRITSIVGSSTADPVPAGSVVPFYNNAAPSGYTVVALNDYALQVVSSGGGATSGSVAYSTLFTRTATDGYTLTTNDIPSHTHPYTVLGGSSVGTGSISSYSGTGTSTLATQATGGGAAHVHAIDMRLKTATIILATRN